MKTQIITKRKKRIAVIFLCLIFIFQAFPIVGCTSDNTDAGAGGGTTESLEITNADPIETEQTIDTTVEHTQIPYQYVLSREEFDEMTEAWKIFRNSESAYITRTYEEFSYYYPCQGFTCVYLKKQDFVVFCNHIGATLYGELSVAGYLFKLPSMEKIWVYKNKEFYSLSQAYELRILDEEDIKELSEIHHEHLFGENRFG